GGAGSLVAPLRDRAPRSQHGDAVDTELGELLHDEVGLGSLREGERDDEARGEARLDDGRVVGAHVDRARRDPSDVVRAPGAAAVGGGEHVTGSQSPHTAEMVPGFVVESDVVVQRRDEGVRDRRVPSREPGHYWKAERTRSKNPRSGAAT